MVWSRIGQNKPVAILQQCNQTPLQRHLTTGSSTLVAGQRRPTALGFRANLGVADDLFGSREDAYSETVRQKRWDWYVDDFFARLKPGAKRILMNTRWHEEDVAGRV
jgi:hypothetical protein